MSDELVRSLAAKAGIDTVWRDQSGQENGVSIATLRALLTDIGLPSQTDEDTRNSLSVVEMGASVGLGARFLTARVGQNVVLPIAVPASGAIEIELENGSVRSVTPLSSIDGLLTLPPFDEPGYHRIRTTDAEFTLAAAPTRCVTIADLGPDLPAWGLAAQIYSLRRPGDGGVGDFGAAADLARAAAAGGAQLLALSPVHALFAAEPRHISPYSPSSRLFYNPIHADPRAAFPDDLVRQAIETAGVGAEMARLEALDRVDWQAAGRARMAVLRALYAILLVPSHAASTFRKDFDRFRAQASPLLQDHCAFEALHAHHLAEEPARWAWWDWAPEYRDCESPAVREFVAANQLDVDFHLFLQWVTSRSYADCQRVCHDSGMRVGLVADLAIGMERTGSHAWSRPRELLAGASIGAPPDHYNADGQNWGLTGFSPRGLAATSFQPFIETLRAAMRYAGGVRIDHVMGMNRLWLVPQGARPSEGAYLNFPSESLFRLIALESHRHKAIVIGEDLGTLPDGFRDYLRQQGVAGMRVLRFERTLSGYRTPWDWDPAAVALTTTHDVVPTAGWWAGDDLGSSAAPDPDGDPDQSPQSIRAWDRGLLWGALEQAGVAGGERPAPHEPEGVVTAAIDFVARTPCQLRLLSIEDALAIPDQPNIPGTEDPRNWTHRLAPPAADLLRDRAVIDRLRPLGFRQPPDAA